ncbi:hypothetical protein K431DRAFT_219571, partial [Polychaeton citri CBS 116435]
NANANQFPPPKTDKPRPHMCQTCGRAFARLEHLKRHERSHTKEKPFECPECARCFARRDLLLRHQQKLHMTGNTGPRPRNGRRESVGGASVSGAGRVRKNSIASASAAGLGPQHRPRANTISHIDISSLGLNDGMNPNFQRMGGLGIQTNPNMNINCVQGTLGFDYRGMSTAMGHHGHPNPLPKLDTTAINNRTGVLDSLRTAPPLAGFGGFDIDQLFSPGTTVNPAQLHFGGSRSATQMHFQQFPAMHSSQPPMIDENDEFGWMRNWNMQISNGDNSENAIEESSPSRLSSGDSPGDFADGQNNPTSLGFQPNLQWPSSDVNPHQTQMHAPFQLDSLGNGLPAIEPTEGMLSPDSMQDAMPVGDAYFQQSLMQQQQMVQMHSFQQQEMMQSHPGTFFATSMSNFSSESPSMSSSSMTGSARQSSITSASTDSITDSTRQALLTSLSQPSVFGGHNHRKYSQPTISSPLSPTQSRGPGQGPSLPSTSDIRRYVESFIHHAHPHLPVTHLPTLSFDSIDLGASSKSHGHQAGFGQGGHNSVMGGLGCLVLGMAAIGALYEYDHPASKELFEAAKKMISLYLEERRKADMSAAVNGSQGVPENNTPLWLVQAMLLTVIYGHQCGDRTAADIASTHSAALVSLARAADLARSPMPSQDTSFNVNGKHDHQHPSSDINMDGANGAGNDSLHLANMQRELHAQWLQWKEAEERKRTLFAIFIISSLLTTAYNQTPTIMNSEILLDLPCNEELWAAETAQDWQNRGGLAAAEASSVSFAGSLSILLTANQRQNEGYSNATFDPLGDNDLRPSTFGCLVLINALHNYIWETRSRHTGRQWTAQETESMFSHIEPALNAWQAAWKSNERHKLDRPNPFGLGPLSADCIPLLDSAFVRLFINLGRSKEAFWQRDFDAMSDELAKGAEVVQSSDGASDVDISNPDPLYAQSSTRRPSQQVLEQAASRRERHLRKAAFYAADSLTIGCNYNLTYFDASAHELPIQSAMCFFDCGQVLAEWACTVQERVGQHLGMLGRDSVDFTQVPAIMLLETEDVELLRKIERICDNMEAKRFQQENLLAMDLSNLNPSGSMPNVHNNVNLSGLSYASKILRVVAMMLEKAVVWPVTHVMGKALETQASHMDRRTGACCAQ